MTKHAPIKEPPQAHDGPHKGKAKAETAKNIYQRLAEAMLAVSYVQKQKPASDGLKYSVVTHDAVTSKCRPALLKAGIVYHPVNMIVAQNGNRTEVQMVVRFVNIDDPKDYIETPSIGYGIDTQDKGPGKATSYAVKYALLKTLGLETGDDADLESIEHEASIGITGEQFIKLRDMVQLSGADEAKFLLAMGEKSLTEFSAAKFENAMKALQKKLDAVKEEANGTAK